MSAISPSSKYITFLVCLIMAVTSEATVIPSSAKPKTKGLPFLAATNLPGSS